MKHISEVVACVTDRGLFTHIAQCMAEQCQHVYYAGPTERVMRRFEDDVVGDGLDNITRIDSPFDVEDIADVFCFPDVGFTSEQKKLRRDGRAVFGHHGATELEIYKGMFLGTLEELGMEVPPHQVCIGMDELAEYLRDKEDVFIKLSKWREGWETAHWRNELLDGDWLRGHKFNRCPARNHFKFYVFDKIDSAVEDGIDTWCVDGEWPKTVLHGMERKDCYDPETEVMTDLGWKRFSDLDGSEDVLTLNLSDPRHYKVEYQHPTAYVRDTYKGKMIRMESDNYDLLVTPNHKLLMQVNSQNEQAETVSWKGVDGVVRKFRRGKRNRTLVRAENVDFTKWQSMPWPSSGKFSGAKALRQVFIFGGVRVTYKKFARFLGCYLSEGWTNGMRSVVSQTKYVTEFEEVLNACGFKYSKSRNRSTGNVNFEISNRELGAYLAQFGKAAEKHVPQWIKMSDWRVINEFLHWYCMGDGSFLPCEKKCRGKLRRKTSTKYYTISKQMADDLQELLAKCGRQSIIAEEWANEKPKYVVSEHAVQRKNYILPHHVSRVDYDGEIFCVTVPNHIILVRRNNKPTWCGNSSFLGGIMPMEAISEEIRSVNEKFGPLLFERYGYRGPFSTEVRPPYFIDPTLRMPSPPSQIQTALITNLPEVIYKGAHGILVEPEFDDPIGAQVLVTSDRDEAEWLTIPLPTELQPYFKASFACEIDGVLRVAPNPLPNWAGWLVATGKTIEAVVETLKERKAMLPEGFDCDLTSIADLLRELEDAKKEGIEISDQETPPQEIVLEETHE